MSSAIWTKLAPLIEGSVSLVALPGHGARPERNCEWRNIWNEIEDAALPEEWPETILVLHSFSAAIFPELIASKLMPKKVILLEGIVCEEKDSWSRTVAQLSDQEYERWVRRFRSVSRMALKHQLISNPAEEDLVYWSNAFKQVHPAVLRRCAINLQSRLNSVDMTEPIARAQFPVTYVFGERTRLKSTFTLFSKTAPCDMQIVANSGHFPMIDNPAVLVAMIKSAEGEE